MGKTNGDVEITCPGRGMLRFASGEDVNTILKRSRQKFGGSGSIIFNDFEVTGKFPNVLEGGVYEYFLDGMGIFVCVAF